MTELTLHRLGTGGAPTMVLVHGLTEDGTSWPDAIEHWRRTYDLIAVEDAPIIGAAVAGLTS